MLPTNLIYSLLPTIVKENIELATFFALLSYVLFLINWIVTTGKHDARRDRSMRCQVFHCR